MTAAGSDKVRFPCPNCLQTLKAPAAITGKTVQCPHCNAKVQVPGPSPAPSIPAGTNTSIRTACPLCGKKIIAEAAQSGSQVECPDCLLPVTIGPARKAKTPDPSTSSGRKPITKKEHSYSSDSADWGDEVTSAFGSFEMQCPKCKAPIQARQDQIGDAVRCSMCNTKVMVRLPNANTSANLTPVAPKVEAEDDDEFRLSEAFDRPSFVPMPSNTSGNSIDARSIAGAKPRASNEPRAEEDTDFDHRSFEEHREQSRVQWDGKLTDTKWPFIQGVFSFLFRPVMLGMWGIFSTTILGLGLILYYLNHEGMLSMALAGLLAAPAMIWWVSITVRLVAITEDTAAGLDEIEGWPDAVFLDWIAVSFYVINSLLLGCFVSWGLTLLFTDPLVVVALAGIVVFLTYPIFHLSLLDNASAFQPFSFNVLQSLGSSLGVWLRFYLVAAGILAIVMTATTIGDQIHATGAIVTLSIAGVGSLFIYARLMGRLAWALNLRARETDADES